MGISKKLDQLLEREKCSSYHRYSITNNLLSSLYYHVLNEDDELRRMRSNEFVGIIHLAMACCVDFHKGRIPDDQFPCLQRLFDICPQLMERDALWAAAHTPGFLGEVDLLQWAFKLPQDDKNREKWISCFAYRAATHASGAFTEWINAQTNEDVSVLIQALPPQYLTSVVRCFQIRRLKQHQEAFFESFGRLDLVEQLLDTLWPVVVENGLQQLANITRGYFYGTSVSNEVSTLCWMWIENEYTKRTEATSCWLQIAAHIRQTPVVGGPVEIWSRLLEDGDTSTASVFQFEACAVWNHLVATTDDARLSRQANAAIHCIHAPATLEVNQARLVAFARFWPHLTAESRDKVWSMWAWDKVQYSHWQVIETLVTHMMPLAPAVAVQHALVLANLVTTKLLPASGTLGYGGPGDSLIRTALLRPSGVSCPLQLDCLDVAHVVVRGFSLASLFSGVTRFHKGDCEALVRGASVYEQQLAILVRKSVSNREPGQVTQRNAESTAMTSLEAVIRQCEVQERLDHMVGGAWDFSPHVSSTRKHLLTTAAQDQLTPLLCHIKDMVQLCTSYLF